MLVSSDIKVNSKILNGIHGMPLTRMRIEKKDTLPCAYNRGTHAIFATGTKLLDIKSEVYRPGGDLVETNY